MTSKEIEQVSTDKAMIDEETLNRIIELRDQLDHLELSLRVFNRDGGLRISIGPSYVKLPESYVLEAISLEITVLKRKLKSLGFQPSPLQEQEHEQEEGEQDV